MRREQFEILGKETISVNPLFVFYLVYINIEPLIPGKSIKRSWKFNKSSRVPGNLKELEEVSP
jgi:hypothetical protein